MPVTELMVMNLNSSNCTILERRQKNLTGYTFTNGINYAFTSTTTLAPGAYLVIVKNVQFFDIRYPSVINIAPGEYDGSLSNSGEKITFKDLNDETIVSVEYNDEQVKSGPDKG